MVGHTLDILMYRIVLEKLDCEGGFSRTLCGVKSIEKREA